MEKDLYTKLLVVIAIWFAVVTIFGVWEYSILKAEMVLNQKLLSHERIVESAPLQGGKIAYVLEMFVWTTIILALGYVWSKALFPHRNLLERIVFSFVLGIFAMPLSIFIPFTFITVATVFSTLTGATPPAYIGPTLNNIVGLFVNGQEQIYEFANVFFFFILGLIVLGLRKSSGSEDQKSAMSPFART